MGVGKPRRARETGPMALEPIKVELSNGQKVEVLKRFYKRYKDELTELEDEIRDIQTAIAEHEMAIFSAEPGVELEAAVDSRIAIVGGEPVGQRFIEWNFVSSRAERIEQAKADWQAGNFPSVPGDEEEFKRLIGKAVRTWRKGDQESELFIEEVNQVKEDLFDAMFNTEEKKIERRAKEFRGYLMFENE